MSRGQILISQETKVRDETAARSMMLRASKEKPISAQLNYNSIISEIWDIQSECADIHWMTDELEDVVDILGEDQAFEFKMLFAELDADCMRMLEEIEEREELWELDDTNNRLFDLLWAATADDVVGYDDDETSDYVEWSTSQRDWEIKQANKRLQRLTKAQLLEIIGISIGIVRNYLSIKYRYNRLAGVFDIIREKNGGLLQTIRSIEGKYEAWIRESDGGQWHYTEAEKALDRALAEMPERVWVE